MSDFCSNRKRAILASWTLSLLLTGVCSIGLPSQGLAQRLLPPRLKSGDRPLPKTLRERRSRLRDPQAMQLLRRMVQARTAFVGEQITEIAERGMQTSRMRVWGDKRGRVRRDYVEPDALQGDVMLIAPNQYRYLHKRRNVLDIALWPTSFSEREKRIFRLIAQGALSVQRVGEEVIADRNADIVLVSLPARQMKFWIDRETGLQLKNEMSNAGGLVSRSYMTTIQVGTEANVPASLFEPAFLHKARPNPLFPPTSQYNTVEEVQDKLPFAPLQPASLPPGFKLTGVWIIAPEDTRPAAKLQTTVLLRYSDGVGSFSLFQRQAKGADKPIVMRKHPAALRRSVQHWRTNTQASGMLDIIYIGTLPPALLSALYDSLR